MGLGGRRDGFALRPPGAPPIRHGRGRVAADLRGIARRHGLASNLNVILQFGLAAMVCACFIELRLMCGLLLEWSAHVVESAAFSLQRACRGRRVDEDARGRRSARSSKRMSRTLRCSARAVDGVLCQSVRRAQWSGLARAGLMNNRMNTIVTIIIDSNIRLNLHAPWVMP